MKGLHDAEAQNATPKYCKHKALMDISGCRDTCFRLAGSPLGFKIINCDGPERDEHWRVAVHEAGHAVAGVLLEA
jgi:hypothetical protein